MRIIVINKKKLVVFIIIVGFMCTLLGLGKNFENKIKTTIFIQNNIKVLKTYDGLDKKLSYKLPSLWTANQLSFNGGEIIYHNDFKADDIKIHGFVEVWNLNDDLKNFLDKSKDISDMQNINHNYTINKIKVNDKSGYLVTYDADVSTDATYKAYEYFIQSKGQFIRFSFFIRQEDFKENMPAIFNAIVQTLNYSN